MSKGKSRSRMMRGRYIESIKATGSITCGICLRPINYIDDLTVDHIFPRVKGGNSRLSNLQPAHERCNSQKADKLIHLVQDLT